MYNSILSHFPNLGDPVNRTAAGKFIVAETAAVIQMCIEMDNTDITVIIGGECSNCLLSKRMISTQHNGDAPVFVDRIHGCKYILHHLSRIAGINRCNRDIADFQIVK